MSRLNHSLICLIKSLILSSSRLEIPILFINKVDLDEFPMYHVLFYMWDPLEEYRNDCDGSDKLRILLDGSRFNVFPIIGSAQPASGNSRE